MRHIAILSIILVVVITITSHMWGTGELGRMMFWKVFGVEYTPTSWTGVNG